MLPTTSTTHKKPMLNQVPFTFKHKPLCQPSRHQTGFLEDIPSAYQSQSPQIQNSTDCFHRSKKSNDSSSDQTCDSLNSSGLLKKQSRSKLNYFSSKFSQDSEKRTSQIDITQKFKTELCKNFQLKGFCFWGDTVL
jgi:hypothetical protein